MSDAIDMGEILSQMKRGNQAGVTAEANSVLHHHRVICVMCNGTRTVIALEPKPDKPVLCHSCYRQVIPQYPALPLQVVGRYLAGPSFMDEYENFTKGLDGGYKVI